MAVSDEVSVGIVGCGRCTTFGHLPALAKLKGKYHIAAVCDVVKSRRDCISAEFPDARHYRRIEDMVDAPDINLVLVATPTLEHESIVLECLNRGLWTVCETPVAVSHDGALVLRGASVKVGRKLIAATPALFSNEFRLAMMARSLRKIGRLYDIRIRKSTYQRRMDWQATAKRAGGAAHFAAQEPTLQALTILGAPPVQMWSETKKLVALGDAEDYVRLLMRTADGVTADIETNSAVVRTGEPEIMLRGTRGSFSIFPGTTIGRYAIIDPAQHLPNKRSSVALPPLEAQTENIRVAYDELALPDPMPPYEAFWKAVYRTVVLGEQFPVDFDLVVEMSRYIGIVRKSIPIAI